MIAEEITGLYDTLRTRISAHLSAGCSEITLKLSPELEDELAFYRLVFWGYALVHEAARIPFSFLTSLSPLKADRLLIRETSDLRTFLAHNLDMGKRRDRRINQFVHGWFKEACGDGQPESNSQFESCCARLGSDIGRGLAGAIEACELLDSMEDGSRLVQDLRERVDLAWEASRFDPVVSRCAERLGNPGLDLRAFRARNLERWRRFLAQADQTAREQALEQRIEADLLAVMDGALPASVRAGLQRISASREGVGTGLLLLSNARSAGTLTMQQILELVDSSANSPG